MAAGLSVSFRLSDLIKLELLFGGGGVISGVGNSDNLWSVDCSVPALATSGVMKTEAGAEQRAVAEGFLLTGVTVREEGRLLSSPPQDLLTNPQPPKKRS